MRATIYHHIRQRLKPIEEIKWIDLDTRQVSEPKENYPIPFPAVLMTFGNFNYTERTQGTQEVVVNVSLNVWQYRYFDAFKDKGSEKIDALFNLIDKIGVAVHNSYIPQIAISPFKRTGESTIAQFGDLFGYTIAFEATLLYCPEEKSATIWHVEIERVQQKQPES